MPAGVNINPVAYLVAALGNIGRQYLASPAVGAPVIHSLELEVRQGNITIVTRSRQTGSKRGV